MAEADHRPFAAAAAPADTGRLKRIGLIAGVVALGIAGAGILSRMNAEHRLQATVAEQAVDKVAIVRPVSATATSGPTLPGQVQAFNSAPIYARTNGYVNRWFVDIGDRVRAGQVLAILDAPEVEQQLAISKAQYQTALANQKLAQSTAVRWQTLLAKDAVSRQEADEKQGDLAAKTAVTNASLADVRRIQALQGFTRITAPFAGTVTSRSTQIGQLVTTGTTAAQPLFTVSDIHEMRVYVRVPQSYSAQIHPGLQATLTVPEYPGRPFPLTVSRTAGAVDPTSGTVLVELLAPNADRALKPGAYAQVSFPGGAITGGWRLPGSAVIFNDAGTSVAVVDDAGRVTLKRVSVARDEGKTVVVNAGLSGRERVIATPPDAVATGDRVQVVEARAPAHG
jgi:RND family efflux transporter MFP subunit